MRRKRLVERRTGVEPASSPWKGEALPLSYRRAHEPPLNGGPATMAVCTDYVALGHLGQKFRPAAVAESPSDVEGLVVEMVEFQYERISLTTINTWVRAEELDQERRSLERHQPLPR
jgi:hypothetical protein